MQAIPMTLRGAEKLREELDFLKSVRRPEIIAAIAEAREHGDLKENAEYHAAREQQGFCEGRIKDIEAKLSNAQVIDVTKMPNNGRVIFGATVTVLNLDSDEEQTYRIVGDDEQLGKNVGDDLNEGKPTLPLLHAMHHGTPEQAQMIRTAIEQGNGRHLLEPVLEAMNACGSLEWTRQRAEEEADKAIAALQVLPDTPWREALIGLAHIAVQRDR